MDNLLGEFIGTLVLCAFGDATVANCLLNKSKGQNAGWVHIVLGWGLAVTMGVFAAVALGAPQADINPAVTFAKMFGGVYTTSQAVMTMVAQTAGGFVGGIVVWLVYLPHWAETEDKAAKLGIFCTGPAIRSYGANTLTEAIGTIFLVVPIMFMVKAGVFGADSIPGWGAFLVGGLVMVIGFSMGGPTGYAINPARDLGPRLAHAVLPIAGKGDSDWAYAWVPIVGPLIGGGVAFAIARAFGLM